MQLQQLLNQRLIAIAIDKDNKGSQAALKWTVDTICKKGQTVLLIHVKLRPPGTIIFNPPRMLNQYDISNGIGLEDLDAHTKELFLYLRLLCTCKNVNYLEVVLEDTDVAKALVEHVNLAAIEVLVLGAARKGGLFRFKGKNIPETVSKGVPDFCSVYVISKAKVSTARSASCPAPTINPLRNQILEQGERWLNGCDSSFYSECTRGVLWEKNETPMDGNDYSPPKSQFCFRRASDGQLYELASPPDPDVSFSSSERPSVHRMSNSTEDDFENGLLTPPRLSRFSDSCISFRTSNFGGLSMRTANNSFISNDSNISTPHNVEDVEVEMTRLKEELKRTLEMYNAACKEALTANQKALELEHWRAEEEKKAEAARLAEEVALTLEEKEKAKSKAALEHNRVARRIEKFESRKLDAERKELKKTEKNHDVDDTRYRKYSIDEIEIATDYFSKSRKVGEGGYGPVFKCILDHTPVAVKVLRPDASEGRSQFQQEVEVLCSIRHPNMVLLLGTCPEYGCLVYEYMSKGSLEDRLLQRGKTPPLSWQARFRIAAEITRALLFLHQTKPEPIVHRDLKPANILLDDNLVSKISDVGLARLIPPSVADSVTQCRMTSAAGTFCYIDPEYQQTGMLSTKSDEYSLGVIYLQILTAKPPMGLTRHVRNAIKNGSFSQILDPSVPDWPIDEALCLANLALKCSELRRRDRPELGKVVMPELERLMILAEENISNSYLYSEGAPLHRSQISLSSSEISCPTPSQSGSNSSTSH